MDTNLKVLQLTIDAALTYDRFFGEFIEQLSKHDGDSNGSEETTDTARLSSTLERQPQIHL